MNMDTRASLDAIFDVQSDSANTITTTTTLVTTSPASLVPASPETTEAEQHAQEDFTFSRGALKSVATEAQNTLHRAVEVAEQTDTPRAFEAVADMVRATLEAHRELQQLHKTAAEVRLATKTAQTPVGQVNIDKGIVFNGSPDELLKLIDPSRQ